MSTAHASRFGGAALERLLAGERRSVALAISEVERGQISPGALAAALAGRLGRAHVIGLTGAPGAGKSTLVDALLGALLARGRRIGVVAVDPSSPLSGGAVLGDRVRMGPHGAHRDVYIRSLASRGQLGGLSHCTREVVDVLDAAGFDTVIVETVGAGQSDVDIMNLADTKLVACPPGLGDAVQAIKAGILEIADILVVTKSDLAGAAGTAADLRQMQALRGAAEVPVVPVCATGGEGVAALLDRIEGHRDSAGRGRRLRHRGQAPAGDEFAARVYALAAADPFARALGMGCTEAGAGHATVTLTLREDHLNFMGSCHGGVVFALADTAFGLAANSHGRVAAGIDAHISYQHAARRGQTLVARAVETSKSGRLGFYRVDVTLRDGPLVSTFSGTVSMKT